jgi:hypothetical protein
MLTGLSLGENGLMHEHSAAHPAVWLVNKRGIQARQVLRGCFDLAENFQVIKPSQPSFQTIRAVKFFPDVPGILMIFYDHMKKNAH